VRDILRDTEQRIRAELNPEQQTKFDVWVRARRDNWNQ
jgi:hypothetical protein